jgi:predicted  nucleic acid-binding Zn-ribbon protein
MLEKPHRCNRCGHLISEIEYEDFEGYCEECAMEIIEDEDTLN